MVVNIEVKINYDKTKEDEKWDGLKGYITNTDLKANNVYEQYSELWQIERAFRVTKGCFGTATDVPLYKETHWNTRL